MADENMRIDPDVLIDAAEILDRELRSLSSDGMGTPTNLRTEAQLPPGANWFGRWDTAQEMETGYRTAWDRLLFYYDEMIGQLTRASALLRTTAAEQQATDEAGQTAFNTQAAAMDGTGPASDVQVA